MVDTVENLVNDGKSGGTVIARVIARDTGFEPGQM
jgi:hypothetical protein